MASIGYGREPEFEVQPPGAPGMEERIGWAVRGWEEKDRKVVRETEEADAEAKGAKKSDKGAAKL